MPGPLSPERRAALTAAVIGSGNGNWAGDNVGYKGAHMRADGVLPKECAHCGAKSSLDAALISGRGVRKDVRGRWFSPHPEDYIRLCRSCHKVYDLGN